MSRTPPDGHARPSTARPSGRGSTGTPSIVSQRRSSTSAGSITTGVPSMALRQMLLVGVLIGHQVDDHAERLAVDPRRGGGEKIASIASARRCAAVRGSNRSSHATITVLGRPSLPSQSRNSASTKRSNTCCIAEPGNRTMTRPPLVLAVDLGQRGVAVDSCTALMLAVRPIGISKLLPPPGRRSRSRRTATPSPPSTTPPPSPPPDHPTAGSTPTDPTHAPAQHPHAQHETPPPPPATPSSLSPTDRRCPASPGEQFVTAIAHDFTLRCPSARYRADRSD